MERQLRPRRQGIPADHNYFAPYPNTIYTTPVSSTLQSPHHREDVELQPPPPKKKRKASTQTDSQISSCDVAKGKRRWRYFGYRRKRRGAKYNSKADDQGEDGCHPMGDTKRKRKTGSKKKTVVPGEGSVQVRSSENDLVDEDPIGISRCKCCTRWRLSRKERRHSQRLVIKNFKLPFDKLPDLCKLAIFSFLSVPERGKVAQVCQEWRRLVRHSGLWSHIDFNVFNPTHCNVSPRGLSLSQYPWFMTVTEYNKYCLRMQKYMIFLEDVKPHVRFLRFAYDLVNPKDEWLKHLSSFISHANCKKLQTVDMNWTATPVRPPCADRYCCFFNKARIALQKHIKRVLVFHQFLGQLTRAAPAITHASLPFDWSERSVLLLCRWRHLEVLRLDSYIQLRLLLQELLDVLLARLGRLRELQLTVCTPLVDTADNKNFYSISHPQLRTLNVTGCNGMFLRALNTPGLVTLEMPPSPWIGASGTPRRRFYPPCLYSVLRQGAPKLTWLNHHRLLDYWLEYPYEELENILNRTCSCKTHSKRLVLQQAEENQH